ncbi:hypothetical protein [Caulobacter sp. LARHSG274]
MAQAEDRSRTPIPSDLAPEGETQAIYDADDNLEIDAGDEPRNDELDQQHGRKTRQARKDEISRRPI